MKRYYVDIMINNRKAIERERNSLFIGVDTVSKEKFKLHNDIRLKNTLLVDNYTNTFKKIEKIIEGDILNKNINVIMIDKNSISDSILEFTNNSSKKVKIVNPYKLNTIKFNIFNGKDIGVVSRIIKLLKTIPNFEINDDIEKVIEYAIGFLKKINSEKITINTLYDFIKDEIIFDEILHGEFYKNMKNSVNSFELELISTWFKEFYFKKGSNDVFENTISLRKTLYELTQSKELSNILSTDNFSELEKSILEDKTILIELESDKLGTLSEFFKTLVYSELDISLKADQKNKKTIMYINDYFKDSENLLGILKKSKTNKIGLVLVTNSIGSLIDGFNLNAINIIKDTIKNFMILNKLTDIDKLFFETYFSYTMNKKVDNDIFNKVDKDNIIYISNSENTKVVKLLKLNTKL